MLWFWMWKNGEVVCGRILVKYRRFNDDFEKYFLDKFLIKEAFFGQYLKRLPDGLSLVARAFRGFFYPLWIYAKNIDFLYKMTNKKAR